MDSSSSYHTCASVDVSKLSPPLEAGMGNNIPVSQRKHVEFVDNNNFAKIHCNVSRIP